MSNGYDEPPGLDNNFERDYPKVVVTGEDRPIDRLRPDSDAHGLVLDYIRKRVEESERCMANFWPRWIENELKVHAYISLADYEQKVKKKNQAGESPKPVSIIIPTTQATVATIATYLTHTFTGRHPIIQVGTYKDEYLANAANMETVIQYNHDHSRSIRNFAHMAWDWQIYGFAGWRIGWNTEFRMKVTKKPTTSYSLFGEQIPGPMATEKELHKCYEGNKIISIDPYGFFPDPRVPLHEVAETGEYVFWRTWEGKHSLLKDEFDGHLKWVKSTPSRTSMDSQYSDPHSMRSEIFGGKAFPGHSQGYLLKDNYKVDQGTCEIIPRELGLGDSERPEKWMFTMLNSAQIVQAEPFESYHGMHPVAITEPMVQGYGFGNAGTVDFIAALQDAISWLYNSHQDNVRKVINNDLIVAPDMIVMKDLKPQNNEVSRVIRLKRTALGQDVKNAISQLRSRMSLPATSRTSRSCLVSSSGSLEPPTTSQVSRMQVVGRLRRRFVLRRPQRSTGWRI